MKKFKDLEFLPKETGGVQAKMTFKNGRGVSVIISQYSYGGSEGLYELAVLGKDGLLDYSTPITDDVLGWLRADDVEEAMNSVEKLD